MTRRENIVVGIDGSAMFFKLDIGVSSERERILPDIVRSDEPDRGDIEPRIEIRGDYPRLVRKGSTIESTIKKHKLSHKIEIA